MLFAIHLSSRRVHVLGVTRNPDSAWVTQQARNLAVGERFDGIRFVIRDRDAKYTGPFDEVFRSEGIRIIRTPILAPRANAFAERWVRTVRAECLDWMLIFGRRHLEHVLRAYVIHYNRARPHRGLELRTPEPRPDRARWPSDRPTVRTQRVWAGSSVSTNWLLDRRIEGFCALQGTDLGAVPPLPGIRGPGLRLLHGGDPDAEDVLRVVLHRAKTRRVHIAGATTNPDSAWVTQQARNVSGNLRELGVVPRFLIRDRDTKFTAAFDAVFEADGARAISTPIRTPNANAHAERWVGTARAECLDWILIRGRRHLERVLREYVRHYNDHRPHRAMGLLPPDDREGGPHLEAQRPSAIRRRPILGGLINEYAAAA